MSMHQPRRSLIPMLGRGWAFPVQREAQAGTLATSEGDDSVRDAIVIILSTRKGERVMRPEFGCDLDRLLFAPNDASSRATAEFEVKEALRQWEPRIDVLGVSARAGGEQGELMAIEVSYRVISTDNRYNLVFPFYLDRALT